MKTCAFCHIKVNTAGDRCPLCKNALDGVVASSVLGSGGGSVGNAGGNGGNGGAGNADGAYGSTADFVPDFPALESREKDKVLKQVFNIVLVALIGCFLVALLLSGDLYKMWWPFFLGLAAAFLFFVIKIGVFNDRNLGRRINYASSVLLIGLVLIEALFKDYLGTAWWSLWYALPAIPSLVIVTYIVLALVDSKAMSDFYTFIFVEILLNFAPLVVYLVSGGKIGFRFAVYGCVILNIATVMLFSAINLRSVWEEVKKKFHL